MLLSFSLACSILTVVTLTITAASTQTRSSIKVKDKGLKVPLSYVPPQGLMSEEFITTLRERPLFTINKYNNIFEKYQSLDMNSMFLPRYKKIKQATQLFKNDQVQLSNQLNLFYQAEIKIGSNKQGPFTVVFDT
eukprot:Pgem_evm1s1257